MKPTYHKSIFKKENIINLGIICYFLFGWSTGVYAQETTAEIIKLINDKAQTIQSYRANFLIKMQGPQGEMVMNGAIQFKRPDKIKIELSMPNIPNATQLVISDGNKMWQYVPYLKIASSIDLGVLKKEFGDVYFAQQREDISQPLKGLEEESIKYLGKEKLDSKECFVLEAKPKQLSGQEKDIALSKVWIDAVTGLERKSSFFNEKGEEVLSRIFQTIETNLEISDAEFIFSLPEGVKVIDMTDDTRKIIEAENKAQKSPNSATSDKMLPPLNP